MVNDNKNHSEYKNGDFAIGEFKPNDYVVYPTHGVGRIVSIEENEIAGEKIELIVISFEQEKMTLRVPTYKVKSSGMRPLAGNQDVDAALEILKGRAKVRRTMWSRRAQEYETKINSGNLTSLAEVVRDLYKGCHNNEQSYSERQLFEVAYERLVREISAINSVSREEVLALMDECLNKKEAA